jgi:hypothetical protein
VAVPSQTTFVAGNKLTAAQLNTNVRDAVNFLLAPPAVALSNSAAQLIPTSTFTVVTLDSETLDNDNMHSTVSNTGRITAVTPGFYQVSGNIEWASNATGARYLRLRKNTTPVNSNAIASGSASGSTPMNVSAMIQLAVGDFVDMDCFQASGGNLNIGASLGNGSVSMTAVWVHS